MKFIVPLVCFMLMFSNPVSGQVKAKQFSKSADSLMSIRLVEVAPGAVVLVVNKGNVIYKKAFGQADIKTGAAMKTDYVFRIGSIGKQFTAVAILQLVDQGKLKLNDSIQQFIPDFPVKLFTITIAQLLSQTSGIRNYFDLDTGEKPEVVNAYSPKQIIDVFGKEPLQFVPGTKFQYSNSNYFLLGYIIEKVTGLSYKDYLIEHVIKKAGLKSTFYIDPARVESRRATPYSRFDGKIEDAELQSINLTYAAGGLESTAEDLLKWHQALHSGKLIRPETLTQALTPYKFADGSDSEYGFGWFLKNLGGQATIEHSGSTDGYQTDVVYLPKQDLLVVTLFNCFESDMDWQTLTNDLAKLAIGEPTASTVELTDKDMKEYTGTYQVIVEGVNHELKVSQEGSKLFVEGLNPNDRLPKVRMYAETVNKFYIKEAQLKFEFVRDEVSGLNKIVTYNNRGKDAEWKKQ
nr:serine hydrolase domain-containing protein [Pedobacter panaciterrae]